MSVSIIEHLFGPRGPDIRESFGYCFAWTPQHLTEPELEPLRHSYDKLADEANVRIQELRGKRGIYQTLEEEHENDEVLGKLWKEVTEVPEWVDWEQIERGQEVFYRYALGMV